MAGSVTPKERRVLAVVVCLAMAVAALSDLTLAAAFGWRAMVAGLLCLIGGIVWALALSYASMKEHYSNVGGAS